MCSSLNTDHFMDPSSLLGWRTNERSASRLSFHPAQQPKGDVAIPKPPGHCFSTPISHDALPREITQRCLRDGSRCIRGNTCRPPTSTDRFSVVNREVAAQFITRPVAP